MSVLKAGVIGCGNIARTHMGGYQTWADEVKVVACCDIDKEKAEAFAQQFGIERVYTDCREMMKAEELDVVSVTTWNKAHKECTIAALEGGANVICEKPMAMNAQEACEMKATADRTGKLLQIGFVRRFGNDAKAFLDFKAQGTFGDLYYAKANYLRRSGCPGGWFGDKSLSGGGPLIDLGVHVMDLVRYLAGNPKPVSVFGVTYNNLGPNRAGGAQTTWTVRGGMSCPYTVEDFVSAMIRFDNGLTLAVEAAFNLNVKEDTTDIYMFGTKAGAKVAPELEIYTDMAGRFVNIQPATSVALQFNGLFEAEIGGFIHAVQGKEPCRATAEDGIVLMQMIDAIYESARTGHEVLIGE